MSRRRPWLAAMLAFVYPGLGHLYLREWLRALLWFLLTFSTVVYVLDDTALFSGNLDAVLAAQSNLPLWAAMLLFAVTAFSVVDAYWLASRDEDAPTARGTASATGGPGGTDESDDRCSNCRRRIEDDYDFCPWCAEPR
jgi:uncharacterized paraquat-inducible protein A